MLLKITDADDSYCVIEVNQVAFGRDPDGAYAEFVRDASAPEITERRYIGRGAFVLNAVGDTIDRFRATPIRQAGRT